MSRLTVSVRSGRRGAAGILLGVSLLGLPPLAAARALEKGVVIGKVVCREQPDQSYALYLPADFKPEIKRPILYLFDPRADGPAAVGKFKEAAEKFGWILAASNNAQNGPWEPIQMAAWTMFQDSMARLPIDEERIYAGGFSGGARAASVFPLAIKRRIAGVIGIAAGLSEGLKPADLGAAAYFGIAGFADFNSPEMKRLDADLDKTQIPHQVLFYPGSHQWPDAGICRRAVGWMETTAMRQGLRVPDDALIDEIRENDRRIVE